MVTVDTDLIRPKDSRKILNMINFEDKETKEKIQTHLKNIWEIIVKYFKCTMIDSLIIGVVNYVFMLILGMPHSILISIIMGITNIIPNVGPVIGGAIGGIILMFYNSDQALWFLIFTVVLQAIDGIIIKPKLYGESFGISGLWMLVAMLVGGGIFGVVGLVLIVPIVAIAQYLYKNVYLPYKNKKDL